MMNKYKALIVDVDGTLVPNKKTGLPSERVIRAIKKANEKIHIGVASGRPLFLLSHIFNMLEFSGPSILNGGSQIFDTSKKQIIWEQTLNYEEIRAVGNIVWEKGYKLKMDNPDKDIVISKNKIPKKGYSLFLTRLLNNEADLLIDELSVIPTIAIHKVTDWNKGYVGLNITHANATKQHGILEVAKILKIKTHDIIGIGDGYNDFPLLMACGLKVAMGNAVEELKEIADFVAPSVENDGVAEVIEKFILN